MSGSRAIPAERHWGTGELKKPETWIAVGLLVVFATMAMLRAQSEATMWLDETYTLQVAQLPVSQVVDVARADFHPPTYYLALKAWLRLGAALGIHENLLWARSLNLLFWCLALLAVATAGRRWLSQGDSLLLALAIASSAGFATSTQELRFYGPAAACLLTSAVGVFLCRSGRGHRVTPPMLVLSGAGLALWLHHLSWVAVGLLLLVAVVRDWSQRGKELPVSTMALLTSMLIASPSLWAARTQLQQLESADTSWMMPATAPNLLSSLWFWQLQSRTGSPWLTDNLLPTTLSIILLVAVPAIAYRSLHRSLATRAVGLLFIVCFGFVGATWLAARLELAPLFHATRYQLLVSPLLVFSLALLALTAQRRGLGRFVLWSLVGVGLLSQSLLFAREVAQEPRTSALAALAKPDTDDHPVFVVPSSLAGYHESLVQHLAPRLRPTQEICDSQEARVFLLSPWAEVKTGTAPAVHAMVSSGALRTVQENSAPEGLDYYRLLRTELAIPPSVCRSLVLPTASRSFAAVASPADQVGFGWSFLEVGTSELYRWTNQPKARVVFDRAVGPGSYSLMLRGYAPEDRRTELTVSFGEASISKSVSGGFTILEDIPLQRRTRMLRLTSPVSPLGDRLLGVSFLGASLSPNAPARTTAASTDESDG